MGAENWIVKNGVGTEWGLIKRLVLNSGTRQINYADVFVIQTGHIARIPWESFEVRTEGISLRMSEANVVALGIRPSDVIAEEVVSMDVWP